jgi:hypothetical protein
MSATVLDAVQIEPRSVDLPSSILYPELPEAAPLVPGSSDSAPAFQVDCLQKADWCIAKILEAEARMGRRAELAAELHSRIDAWMMKANTPDNDTVSYLSSLLRPFVEAELTTVRRSRSLLLPSGTACLRKLPDRLDIVDPAAAMAWAEVNHPEVIVTKRELIKSELKRLVFREAEAVPGVEAELGQDALYVKAAS